MEQQQMKTPVFLENLKERMWKIEGINTEAKNLHSLKRAKYRGFQSTNSSLYDWSSSES